MPSNHAKQKSPLAEINVRADALTGFIAGFLVGIMGMYVYAIVLSNL